ncbi:MAG: hypothetical protein AAF518_08290 [Spirochaetota bacterium]
MFKKSIVPLGIFVLVSGTTTFAKGEHRFREKEKGTIRGTEINPVTKGIRNVVQRLNVSWASIMSKKKQLRSRPILLSMDGFPDMGRQSQIMESISSDELTYKMLLKNLAHRLSHTFSRIDDDDIYTILKELKKYETKDNFIYMSQVNEWQKGYEDRSMKQKEIVQESQPEEAKQTINKQSTPQ